MILLYAKVAFVVMKYGSTGRKAIVRVRPLKSTNVFGNNADFFGDRDAAEYDVTSCHLVTLALSVPVVIDASSSTRVACAEQSRRT